MAEAPIQSVANRYQLQGMIGEGGMGVVYRAYDRLTNREIALKSIAIEASSLAYNSRSTDRDFHLSLAREFRILASLRHPYIIDVLDYGFDHQPFYTMELIENARTITEASQTLSHKARLQLLYQLLQAIQYLHRRGIIHRDLKPRNILVTSDNTVRVVDFGLAIEHGARQKMAGTMQYIAPEILQGQPASFSSDLYALGIIMLEVVTGHYPIKYSNDQELITQILTGNVMWDPDLLPDALNMFLSRVITSQPEERSMRLQPIIDDLSTITGQSTENVAIRESHISAARFIGRNDELKQLERMLRAIRGGRAKNSMALIRGEAGVGKSRLVDELRIRASVQPDVLVLEGIAPQDRGLPFQMWRTVVRKLMLYAQVDDLQAGVLKDIVSSISELLQRPVSGAPPVAGRAFWHRLGDALLQLLRQQEQTVLLILEDLQWAADSLKLLEHITRHMDEVPHLMIIGTYREEAADQIETAFPQANFIPLQRLTQEDVAAMSLSILGEAGKQEQILNLLNRETEGNTFFIVEVIRDLAELSGGLQFIGEKTLPESVFTGGMYELLVRRLARIPDEYSEITQVAAITGRIIDTNVLFHAFNEQHVQDWLYICNSSSILAVDEQTWLFSHDKIRESILMDTPEPVRPRMHRTVATTIETIYSDSRDYERVLHMHWRAAGDVDKTIEYLIPVATRMVEITDEHEQAQALLEDGLSLLSPRDPRRVKLLIPMGISNDRLGNLNEAVANLTEAIEVAEKTGDKVAQVLAMSVLGLTKIRLGNFSDAEDMLQQVLTISSLINAPSEIARAYNHIGLTYMFRGQPAEAIKFYRTSITMHRSVGQEWGAAMAMNNLGMELARLKDYEQGLSVLQQGFAIREQIGDQWGMASSMNNTGLVATWQRDYHSARAYLLRAMELYRAIGAKRDVANVYANLAPVQLHLGESDVIHSITTGIQLAHEVGATPLILELLAGYAWYTYQQGQVIQAGRIVQMLIAHPVFNIEVQEKLDEWLPQMEQTLSPSERESIMENIPDYDKLIEQILSTVS